MTFDLDIESTEYSFVLYLYTKFGEKIFIDYRDMTQNVKKTEKKTEKKNPTVKQYVAKKIFFCNIIIEEKPIKLTVFCKFLKKYSW